MANQYHHHHHQYHHHHSNNPTPENDITLDRGLGQSSGTLNRHMEAQMAAAAAAGVVGMVVVGMVVVVVVVLVLVVLVGAGWAILWILCTMTSFRRWTLQAPVLQFKLLPACPH